MATLLSDFARTVGVAAVLALSAGCAVGNGPATTEASTSKPHLLALSTYSASLGTSVDAFIANPPSATAQKFELVFEGTFEHPDGRSTPVSMSQAVSRTDAGALRWTSFGPFGNPFTPTDPDVGVFHGKVGVKVTNGDGTSTLDESPMQTSFEVRPSIIVTDLQPTTSECTAPALRLIGAMTYKLKTTTIGFKAATMEYSFRTPSIVPNGVGAPILDLDADGKPQVKTTSLAHTLTAASKIDVVEGLEALSLPPVPQDVQSYGVVFTIVAKDALGQQISSTFGMAAHNPLELYYDGHFELAQVYPATPVSSCIPGGQQGRTVDYTEAKTETRQRQLTVTLSKTWLKAEENSWSTSDGKTITHGTTNTDGYSQTHGTTNSFTFEQNHADSTGFSTSWSDSNAHMDGNGWEAGGSATVSFKPGGVGGEVGGNASKNYSHSDTNTSTSGGGSSSGSTDGWSKGQTNSTTDQSTVDHSTATTDSTAVSATDTKGGLGRDENGGGATNANSWTVSSADTISHGFSASVVAGTYGVFYRQMARYTRRAFVVVYNKCGEGDVVGNVSLQDYVWAPDLALSEKCPPLPISNFPEPQCYVSPCDP